MQSVRNNLIELSHSSSVFFNVFQSTNTAVQLIHLYISGVKASQKRSMTWIHSNSGFLARKFTCVFSFTSKAHLH